MRARATTDAIKRTTYLTGVLTLLGCYTALETVPPRDGAQQDVPGIDNASNIVLDTGIAAVATDVGYDATGTDGTVVDAPLVGWLDGGQGGAPVDTANTATGAALGTGGTSGSGGISGSGGGVVDGPVAVGPEAGPDTRVGCDAGAYACNGTCLSERSPCAGTCPSGRTHCASLNTCIPAAGCCSPADCPVGGPNTVATCTGDVCGIACSSATLTLCGSACSDVTSDPANCRVCGNKCGGAAPRCLSGSCVQCVGPGDCIGNRVCAGNQCVCPNSDAACGAACTPCTGTTPRCLAGACVACIDAGDCASGYSCVGNQCKAPLACGATLPAVAFTPVTVATGTPPLPTGGAITEGVYATTKITCYSPDYTSVSGDSFELLNGQIHRRHVSYTTSGTALSGYEELGSYAASGAAMAVDVVLCGSSLGGQSLWKYTASPTQIDTFTGASSETCIQTFTLQK